MRKRAGLQKGMGNASNLYTVRVYFASGRKHVSARYSDVMVCADSAESAATLAVAAVQAKSERLGDRFEIRDSPGVTAHVGGTLIL